MSLLDGRRLALAAGAVAAVAGPYMLLSGDRPEVPPPPAVIVTNLPPESGATLSYALVAPPFSPARSFEPAAAAPPPVVPDQPPPPPPQRPPLLVGLISGGGKRLALAKAEGGQTVTAAPGDKVGDWRLVSIGRDEAMFQLGGLRHAARLDFSNKPDGRPSHRAPPSEAVLAAPGSSPAGPQLASQQQQQKNGN